jgi:hypothetical protein
MKLPKFSWQQPDHKDQLIKTYFQALEAYADSTNWSDVSCYGHLKPRRWKGGGDGADLARTTLQETENSLATKLTKEY